MDNFKQKNDDSPLRVYKPSAWKQSGLGVVIVFLVIHFSFVTRGIGLDWPMLLLVPLYGFAFWVLIISSTQQHLAIYEHGLEYRMGGNRLFSRWEDMQRFESRRSGKSRIIGIYTIALEKQKSGNFLEMMFPTSYPDFIPLATVVRVPTRWDGCWSGSVVDTDKLAETEFGRDLLHYAPQLFDYGKEKQKNG